MKSVASRAGRSRHLWLAVTVIFALGAFTGQAVAKDAYLGVQLQDLNEALAEAFDLDGDARGVLVSDVVDGSPAEDAGLRRGDVIISFDGDDISDASSFTRAVRRQDPDDEVVLEILRKGKRQNLTVTLGERERRAPRVGWTGRGNGTRLHFGDDDGNFSLESFFPSRGYLGVRVEKMNDDLGRYFGTEEGLLVMEVYEDSGAEKAGLRVGDVIVSAGGEDIASVEDLHGVLEDIEEGEPVAIEVVRDKSRTTMDVEVQDDSPTFLSDNRRFFGGPDGHEGMNFFFSPDRQRSRGMAPRTHRLRGDRDDLQEEMEELREQLRELREQLKELADG